MSHTHSGSHCAQATRPVALRQRQDVVGAVSRRQALANTATGSLAWLAFSLVNSKSAQAEEEPRQRGIGRYIKRRKLEALDTYVPAVLAARSQLETAGSKMRDNLQEAREMIRSGPFNGLRDNVRAIGEYAVKSGKKEAGKFPEDFLSAVEQFDFTLFQAKREGKTPGTDADAAFRQASQAMDRLISTVPKDILDESEKIVQQIADSQQDKAASSKDPVNDSQINQLLQLVPG